MKSCHGIIRKSYGGKDLEKKCVLRREWNTECDKPIIGPENGGQPEDVAEEHGNLSDGGRLFQRLGAEKAIGDFETRLKLQVKERATVIQYQ